MKNRNRFRIISAIVLLMLTMFSGTSAEMVDWCNLQWPTNIDILRGDASDNIYARVYEPGVTEGEGQGAGIIAEVGFGPVQTLPDIDPGWSWFTTDYNMDYGNDDEYVGIIVPGTLPEPGWNQPSLIPSGDDVYEMDMAVSNGTLYAVWQGGWETGGIWFSVKFPDGAWSEARQIVEFGIDPCITASGPFVDIVYSDGTGTWYRGSTNEGTTWSNPVEVYSKALSGMKLASDDDFVYLVYNLWEPPELSDIYFKKKARSSQWFDWPVHIFTLDMYKASVAPVDFKINGDDLYILFQASGTYGVGANLYYESTDQGLTWNGFEFSDMFGVPPYMLTMTQMDVNNDEIFICGNGSLMMQTGGEWTTPMPFWSRGASGLQVTPAGLQCVTDSDGSCCRRIGRNNGSAWGEVRGMNLNEHTTIISDLSEGDILHLLLRDNSDWVHLKWYSLTSTEETGVYDFCSRFSEDNGLTWEYGDIDGNDTGGGGSNGYTTDQAGKIFLLVDEVDWCNLQWPLSITARPGATTREIYGRVYEAGVTEGPGRGEGIVAQVGYGPDMSNPIGNSSAWTWFSAEYNMDYGNNDEYLGFITAPEEEGFYDYCFRFSSDEGNHWIYCTASGNDTGSGGPDGYSVFDAGNLEVKSSFHVIPFRFR